MLQSTIFLEDKNWQMLRGPSRGPGMVITGGVVCSRRAANYPNIWPALDLTRHVTLATRAPTPH